MTRAEREAYKAWLAELKTGDEVAVFCTDREDNGRIEKVKHAWPGTIMVDQGRNADIQFRAENGRSPRSGYHGPMRLAPVTDDVRFAEAVRAARSRLYGLRECQKLTDAKALRIVAILDEPEGGDRG